MDIGNQQRVIIVEPEQPVEKPAAPVSAEPRVEELEHAATWPLPLDLTGQADPVS